jgi:hypothetical protein
VFAALEAAIPFGMTAIAVDVLAILSEFESFHLRIAWIYRLLLQLCATAIVRFCLWLAFFRSLSNSHSLSVLFVVSPVV